MIVAGKYDGFQLVFASSAAKRNEKPARGGMHVSFAIFDLFCIIFGREMGTVRFLSIYVYSRPN